MDKIKLVENGTVEWFCPGCNQNHSVPVNNPGSWVWNNDLENPTISPSVLVRSGHFATHHKQGDNCWCTFNAERISNGEPVSTFSCCICHCFVRNGMIEFLGDCTHKLSGQTVPIPEQGVI